MLVPIALLHTPAYVPALPHAAPMPHGNSPAAAAAAVSGRDAFSGHPDNAITSSRSAGGSYSQLPNFGPDVPRGVPRSASMTRIVAGAGAADMDRPSVQARVRAALQRAGASNASAVSADGRTSGMVLAPASAPQSRAASFDAAVRHQKQTLFADASLQQPQQQQEQQGVVMLGSGDGVQPRLSPPVAAGSSGLLVPGPREHARDAVYMPSAIMACTTDAEVPAGMVRKVRVQYCTAAHEVCKLQVVN